ncbi:MAG: hypothetical protein H7X94_04785 [Vallitaleaceae bacterium]|nr:hypothetical protein [Vallitaleaceae bacterium]
MKENIMTFIKDMGIDDPDDIRSLYADYMTQCDEILKGIWSKMDQNGSPSWIEIEKGIHNLKGVSANLYVAQVQRQAEILDDCLKNLIETGGSSDALILLWEQLCDTYEVAKAEIEQFFILRPSPNT